MHIPLLQSDGDFFIINTFCMKQSDTLSASDDVRIRSTTILPSPHEMKEMLPVMDTTQLRICEDRQHIRNIIR